MNILTLTSQSAQIVTSLFVNTYIREIKERYQIKNDELMDNLLNVVSLSIGSLTNPTKLANTLISIRHENINNKTTNNYLEYICDSFLMERVERYDVKGKRYFESPYKYYFVDLGNSRNPET